MIQFSHYFVEFLSMLWANFVLFLSDFFGAFYNVFARDLPMYVNNIVDYSGIFNFVDWIIFIIVTLVLLVFIFFVGYRFFQLIRRYILFRAKNVSKDKLLEKVTEMQLEIDKLVEEKTKILNLQMGSLTKGLGGDGLTNQPQIQMQGMGQMQGQGGRAMAKREQRQLVPSRFSKLIEIDNLYSSDPQYVIMNPADKLTLSQIVDRFIQYSAGKLGLYYDREIIMQFIAGMGTGKIIILEGISGTGKTSLPYAMGKFFNSLTEIVSVQPSWRDRADLLGYFNEFTKKFNETDFLASLYKIGYRDDPNFIVLDEMNLSRIEYYFAEFLSIMEMPNVSDWKIEIIPSQMEGDPQNIVEGKIVVPQNVWFIGTANNDDSTFTITDKVYDRATALELNQKANRFQAIPTDNYICTYEYLESLFIEGQENHPISDATLSKLKELDDYIKIVFKRSFGNRIIKQINTFVPLYVSCGGTEYEGLDFIICTKILRKFNSLNLTFMKKELAGLKLLFNKLFGKGVMVKSLALIEEFEKRF